MQNEAIEVALVDGLKLVVEFRQRGDRWGHSIWLVGRDGGRLVLLESVEGMAQEAWPVSPVLQNLSMESLTDGRRVAFLVGMAGGSHFSASVEALNDQGAIAFDIACRHGAEPGWLGSQYGALSEAAKRVTIEGDVAVAEIGYWISVRPKETRAIAGTTRWRYVVRLRDSEDELSTEY